MNEPWARVGDDRVAYDGFVRIVHRRLRLPDGRETTWDLLDAPASVAVFALTDDGQVVLVEQYRPGPDRQVVSLPGGLIDPGESVAEAAARELREETGYIADSLVVIAATSPNSATNERHVAVARRAVLSGEPDLDEFEDCRVVLHTIAEVRSQVRTGRLGATEQTYLALDYLGLL